MAGSPASSPRVDLRRSRDGIAIAAARVTSTVSRRLGHGGTSLPGLVAEGLAPGILGRVAEDLQSFSLVSGTNGKTTTTRMLVHILESSGRPTISNASGANLRQAITSTLISRTGLDGRLGGRAAAAVLEVDEATLPRVADALPITLLVMTNLFRDQLDRYGETDEIVRRWRTLLGRLTDDVTLVYCADDPRLAHLGSGHRGPSLGYGLAGPPSAGADVSLTADVTTCPVCDGPLAVGWSDVGHDGPYRCHRCGFARADPWLEVRVAHSRGIDGQTLSFRGPALPDEWPRRREQLVELQLPGVSNAYNAAAAVTAAVAIGVPLRTAIGSLADATPAWGRYEDLEIGGRRVVLTLGKNPASIAELVRVGVDSDVSAVLFAVNDAFPDGRDVSWYWDVNPVPLLAGTLCAISGSSADDFRLRMKYEVGDAAGDGLAGLVGMYEHPADGLDALLSATEPGDTILVVATYTALLELRAALVGRGLAAVVPR